MAFDPPEHPEMLEGTSWVVNKGGCGPHLTPEFEPLFQSILANMAADGLQNACRKAGIKPSDIDMVIAHQAFPGLLDIWSKSAEPIGVPTSRWRSTYDRYGNVGACDVPVTIADLVAENAIEAGATVALFAPGGGGHTPTILMRWNG
jgi:3-oxoacyl-[acyl-carrier-protein] synthase III